MKIVVRMTVGEGSVEERWKMCERVIPFSMVSVLRGSQSAVVPPRKRPILEKFDHHGEACEARSSIRESWLATDDDMQSRFRCFAWLSPTTTTTTRWMLCENEKRTEWLLAASV